MAQKKKAFAFSSLSDAEMKIMNILWDSNQAMTSTTIREESKKHNIDAYAYRLITNLIDKGAISVVGEIKSGKVSARLLLPTKSCTREEYHKYYFQNFCDSSIDGFLSALAQSKSNDSQVVDQIRNWLDEYEQKEK